MQFDRLALVRRQMVEGLGHPQELLLANQPLARRGLFGDQPDLQPTGGIVQRLLQPLLAPHIPPERAQTTDLVGQVMSQHLPQPGEPLRLLFTLELFTVAVGLQQGLLDHAGGVQFELQVRSQLQSNQQVQVGAVLLQGVHAVGVVAHALSCKTRRKARTAITVRATFS